MIPVALGMGTTTSVSWLMSSAGLALTGIAASSSIAYMMFFYTIKTSGPVFASQCAYIVTLSGVIWGIIIFSEEHSFWVWSSIVVMMAGLALVSPRQSAAQAASTAH